VAMNVECMRKSKETCCVSRDLYRVYLAHWNKDTTDIGKVLNIANRFLHDPRRCVKPIRYCDEPTSAHSEHLGRITNTVRPPPHVHV
jgi:hypothetical protein